MLPEYMDMKKGSEKDLIIWKNSQILEEKSILILNLHDFK